MVPKIMHFQSRLLFHDWKRLTRSQRLSGKRPHSPNGLRSLTPMQDILILFRFDRTL